VLVSRLCGKGASRRGVKRCSLSQLDCIFSTVNFRRRVRCSMSAPTLKQTNICMIVCFYRCSREGWLCWLKMCCARTVTLRADL
jgi:hypothetical protein